MRKKAGLATTIIFALSFSFLTGLPTLVLVEANPIGWFNPQINVKMQSPSDGAHYVSPILINFTAQSNFEIALSENNSFFYVLDNQNVDSSGIKFTEVKSAGLFGYSGHATITDIAAGKHTIIIYYVGMILGKGLGSGGSYFNGSLESTTTQFYVDTKPTSTPSPSRTLTPTQQSTAEPTPPEPRPDGTSPFPVALVLFPAVVLAAFMVIVLYLRKRR